MRLVKLGSLLVFFSTCFLVHSSEVDSVRAVVTPVQCYGLRNGVIHVDTVFGGERPFYYSLDGQTFTTNPTFDRLWAGDYTLYVRDGTGYTKNWPITIKEPAELLVKLIVGATKIEAGEPLNIRALASVETDLLQQIEWRPPVLFPRQDTLRHTISIYESTQFAVIVRNQNGCTASDSLTVDVEKTNVYLPNVIKPGSASDAYFTVFAGEGVRRVVSLQVYSRGGALVFERQDFQPNAPLQGWGGRWNGKTAQSGVYLYLAVVEFWSGKQVRYEGTVTVVN
ncbi:MAG: gliding motility-associated C-terminal domain-containing protein [Phycisphaerae bacterium]|nr:gliding motility-associated C-terminal domain-containing protein [Saprospiraceae bacterium]